MKYSIRISVIMPCYNNGIAIKPAIEGILNQTFNDFELIVVNDGSTDDTGKVIKGFSDPRIRHANFRKNKGKYWARNAGMRVAGGKYICFADVGDIASPDRLQVQYDFLEQHPQLGCVGSPIHQTGDNSQIPDTPRDYQSTRVRLLKNSSLIHSTIILRTHLLRKHRLYYSEKLPYTADYDFEARCGQHFPIRPIQCNLLKHDSNTNQPPQPVNTSIINAINNIRLKQLKPLKVTLTEAERDNYLNFLNEAYLKDEELETVVMALNKIIEQNHYLKIYPQKLLFGFFEEQLIAAQLKNRLGGWSIEKEVVGFIRNQPTVKRILEFGSGNGTDALLRDFDVTSIEHQKAFAHQRSVNHRCLYAPIVGGWYRADVVSVVLENSFDLIIVDGPPGALRAGLLRNLNLFSGIKTPIIFDDVDRQLDLDMMKEFCKKLNYKSRIIQGKKKRFAFCVPTSSPLTVSA